MSSKQSKPSCHWHKQIRRCFMTRGPQGGSENRQRVFYEEFRGKKPPLLSDGERGDIYVDEAARQVYGKTRRGWERFEGLDSEPIIHPMIPDRMLYPSNSLKQMCWPTLKCKEPTGYYSFKQQNPTVSSSLQKLMDIILNNDGVDSKTDSEPKTKRPLPDDPSSSSSLGHKRTRISERPPKSLSARRDLGNVVLKSEPDESKPVIGKSPKPPHSRPLTLTSKSSSSISRSKSNAGLSESPIEISDESDSDVDRAAVGKSNPDTNAVKKWLKKLSLSKYYQVLSDKDLGTEVQLRRFAGWDEDKLRRMLAETIPNMSPADSFCLADALRNFDL